MFRFSWYNAYRRMKWTRLPEFKSWTRLCEFLIALIPMIKLCIQKFSLELVGQTGLFNLGMVTGEKENPEFKPVKLCFRIDLVSHPARQEGLVNPIYPTPLLGQDMTQGRFLSRV